MNIIHNFLNKCFYIFKTVDMNFLKKKKRHIIQFNIDKKHNMVKLCRCHVDLHLMCYLCPWWSTVYVCYGDKTVWITCTEHDQSIVSYFLIHYCIYWNIKSVIINTYWTWNITSVSLSHIHNSEQILIQHFFDILFIANHCQNRRICFFYQYDLWIHPDIGGRSVCERF